MTHNTVHFGIENGTAKEILYINSLPHTTSLLTKIFSFHGSSMLMPNLFSISELQVSIFVPLAFPTVTLCYKPCRLAHRKSCNTFIPGQLGDSLPAPPGDFKTIHSAMCIL